MKHLRVENPPPEIPAMERHPAFRGVDGRVGLVLFLGGYPDVGGLRVLGREG